MRFHGIHSRLLIFQRLSLELSTVCNVRPFEGEENGSKEIFNDYQNLSMGKSLILLYFSGSRRAVGLTVIA
jgi:hypothetical protein